MLKPITLKDAVAILTKDVIKSATQNSFIYERPHFYLKDGDGRIHQVSEFDLMRDRIVCEDEYFDYFKYVIKSEGVRDKLFVEAE